MGKYAHPETLRTSAGEWLRSSAQPDRGTQRKSEAETHAASVTFQTLTVLGAGIQARGDHSHNAEEGAEPVTGTSVSSGDQGGEGDRQGRGTILG